MTVSFPDSHPNGDRLLAILLLATLDTKGPEAAFVRDRFLAAGFSVLCVDAGVVGEPAFAPDLPRETIWEAAGTRLRDVRALGDRGKAIAVAARGAAVLAAKLHREGRIDAVFGLGGSAGTTIACSAMQVLPYGLPKVMVSTMASGNVGPYVGIRDIAMFHSVVDLCGLNRFSRAMLAQAANAFIGMLRSPVVPEVADKPLLAATMFGVTTPCVSAARDILEADGYEMLVFHATGSGGRTMEAMIRDRLISGVLDITTTELADQLVGGIMPAGDERLTAAAIRGVPQAISVGALDMVNFGPRDTVPAKFEGRRFHEHNPTITLMRTTPEENDTLGREIAEKACAASGPTAVVLPMRGISALDIEGGPFWWPEADAALFQSLRNWLTMDVELIEADLHINDPKFARLCADVLLKMLRS